MEVSREQSKCEKLVSARYKDTARATATDTRYWVLGGACNNWGRVCTAADKLQCIIPAGKWKVETVTRLSRSVARLIRAGQLPPDYSTHHAAGTNYTKTKEMYVHECQRK